MSKNSHLRGLGCQKGEYRFSIVVMEESCRYEIKIFGEVRVHGGSTHLHVGDAILTYDMTKDVILDKLRQAEIPFEILKNELGEQINV